MPKFVQVIAILFVTVVVGYYFWAWPLFVLRYGFAEGSARYGECFSTRGKSMPVEFTYPTPEGVVSTHGLVVVKLKEGNAHAITSSSIAYVSHVGSSPSTFSGMSAQYFIAGNYFPEDALRVNPEFPDKFPDIDIPGRIQAFEAQVKAAGTDAQKLAALQTEGAWEPQQDMEVRISAACYRPYVLHIRTGKE